MKGFIKGMCLTGVALLVFGFMFGIFGFVMGGTFQNLYIDDNGWHFNEPDWSGRGIFSILSVVRSENDFIDDDSAHNWGGTKTSGVITDEITQLDFDLGACVATISVGDEFSYNITGQNGHKFKVKTDNGVFKIELNDELNINLVNDVSSHIEITIPQNIKFDKTSFALGAGKLDIDGVVTKDADFSVGAGKMTIDDFVCEGRTDISVGAASFSLSGDLQDKTYIDVGAGEVDIDLDDTTDIGYNVSVGMGVVQVLEDKINFAGERSVNSDAKRVFNIDCGMGVVNVG